MSLYFYEQTRPFENTLFDVFDDEDDGFFDFNHHGHHQHGHQYGHHQHGHRHGYNRRRNPYRSLERQLCKAFNDEGKEEENLLFQLTNYTPNINLSEDEKNYYIHADLPGMTKDQVKMEINEDRILTISGERESIYDSREPEESKESKESKKENGEDSTEKMETEEENTNTTTTEEKKNKKDNSRKYSRIECSYGKFSRSFTLPEDANLDGVQAKMENGVLEVIINKIETPKPQNRFIQIQ